MRNNNKFNRGDICVLIYAPVAPENEFEIMRVKRDSNDNYWYEVKSTSSGKWGMAYEHEIKLRYNGLERAKMRAEK
jgi:hypothetical protein